MPLEKYEIVKKIGSGKYAAVYHVRKIENFKNFALKRVLVNDGNPRTKINALNEAKLLQTVKHPNIIKLQQVCYDEDNRNLCLILELAKEDLAARIYSQLQPVKEEFIWSILAQISSGLEYLHSLNILHRDIKTSNILLFQGDVAKISDLNVSTTIQKLNYTRTGTISYASPEVCRGQIYDSKSDIWSLGCLLYEVACQKRPFDGQNIEEVSKNIIKCHYPKITGNYSKQLKDLISFMIQINPRLRPSAKTISKICQTKLKNCEGKQKRLEALTPFLERANTDSSLESSIICLENLKSNDLHIPNRQAIRMTKKTHTLKNIKQEHVFEETKKSFSSLKQQSHTYKRIITYKPERIITEPEHEKSQHLLDQNKHINYCHKRLNKMNIHQRIRRHTEV